MNDNSVNQNGSTNYQASANGKKGRAKIVVGSVGERLSCLAAFL